MGTYFINDFNRREIVRMSAALTCATIFSSSRLAAADALRRTRSCLRLPISRDCRAEPGERMDR